MNAYYFVEPLDVLMARGNRNFGAGGEHAEALMPPWPSVFAGAFRSAILAKHSNVLSQFVAGGRPAGSLGRVLGTPAEPGSFRVTWVSLAHRRAPAGMQEARESVLPVMPLPADLVVLEESGIVPIIPRPRPEGIDVSGALPLIATLRARKQEKPRAGRWLAEAAIREYLHGIRPSEGATLTTDKLFERETRLGIALDPHARTAADGALYTTEALSFSKDTGFLVGIDGAEDVLHDSGLLRLGGDGKGARYRRVDCAPGSPAIEGIGLDKRFRLVLSAPGVFSDGWLPGRVTKAGNEFRLQAPGFEARLACAAVPRYETVSGWDLANWRPKAAQRVAPTGSVYWFDQFKGDIGKLAEWVEGGLWGDHEDMSNSDKSRRAEGFNRALLAAWPQMD